MLTREAVPIYPPLHDLLQQIDPLLYRNRALSSYRTYLMGQVCVHPSYRGKGVFDLLYQQHRVQFSQQYELLVTEIATRNHRSIRAHARIGFETIHTYRDAQDEWNVVVWNWHL